MAVRLGEARRGEIVLILLLGLELLLSFFIDEAKSRVPNEEEEEEEEDEP